MDIILGLVKSVLEESFIYGIMVMGVYITYKILDFPDLSVDGTFPLGACATAALITAGVNPWLACMLVFLLGMLAGAFTGFLHVKLKVADLLSGIITMTALWSVNLFILKGSAILQFYNQPTIFTSAPVSFLPEGIYKYRVLLVTFLIVLAVKLLLDWFLRTKAGLLLRAAGDNAQYVTALARDQGRMKVLGLAIGNGCTALAGAVFAQQAESASVSIGTGMVVQALAAVIIGTSVLGRLRRVGTTTKALAGTVLYKAILLVAMLYLPPNALKLAMAALFVAALLTDRLGRKKGGVLHA